MAYSATVYQVLVSSPSDVEEERHAIADVVQLWNSTNSRNSKIVFLPAMWETDATPQLGDRPQALLNRQLVEPSDILIAVFWTRIGSHTGVSESGTIEEIEEFKKVGKRVLIYFSEKPIPTDADVDQFKMVKAFRERIIKENGVYFTHSQIFLI
jgi:hypothetical protein